MCHTNYFLPQNKYKEQYEKMKHRYTAIGDTPLLIRAKKSYIQSSDVSMLICNPNTINDNDNVYMSAMKQVRTA